MAKIEFSTKALQKLIKESAAFSHLFGNSVGSVTGYILKLPQENQKKMFGILVEEKEKMEKIDAEYNKKGKKLVDEYVVKIEDSKRKLIRKIQSEKEKTSDKGEKMDIEKLLNKME